MTNVPVEQKVVTRLIRRTCHYKRLDDSYFSDRLRNLLVLGGLLQLRRDRIEREQLGQQQRLNSFLERDSDIARQRWPQPFRRSAIGVGRVTSLSARRRVTKCSSANNRRRTLTTNSSLP